MCGLLFFKNITRRLESCVEGAHAIAKGDFDYKIEVKTGDETGVLAATFNDMGASLKESREEIESWNRELKKLVEERTQELRHTQSQLIQSSKMTAIGQLGAGIAHEINNPLTGILGQAQLLKRKIMKLNENENLMTSFMKYIDNIENESKRCKVIISNLLRLSYSDDMIGMGLINLNESLKNLILLFENRLEKRKINVNLQFQDNIPPVRAKESQIQQVFLNLITNSYQAMPEGGELRIITQSNGMKTVNVEISDNGKGIAEQDLDRIFEPFFTTKEVWTNTGLGLSVCYAVIKEHKGSIMVESKVGEGTKFSVSLPSI